MTNNKKHALWTEKFRPQTVDQYIFHDPHLKAAVYRMIADKSIPHLLLSGTAGSGKTTLAQILIRALGIDETDVLTINASDEKGIDVFREKIKMFSTSMAMGSFKIIHLEECLAETTLVTALRNGAVVQVPIRDLDDKTDLVRSLNIKHNRIEWKPFELTYKGTRIDTIEIEFDNGETVICTPEHKWYVEDPDTGAPIVVRADELGKFNHVLTEAA